MTGRSQSTVSLASGATVIERLRELPGGSQLLELAAERSDVQLIGGAVRDLLLDPEATPRELDVVVGGDAAGAAGRLAVKLSLGRDRSSPDAAVPHVHDRFGTATVEWPGGRIDLAERRSERYPEPGALPEIRPGTAEQDLERRDFTVNAIAVALGGPQRGELSAVPGALEDLQARHLRVLHEQSFRDDPTRLLRLARYRARLGFEPDADTARLVADAIDGGALDTVSPARLGAELRLALAEADPVAALESLAQLGVLAALHQSLTLDAALARAALEALPASGDAWPDVLLLAALLLPAHAYDASDYETRLRLLLDGYEFPAAERERAVHSAILAPRIVQRLQRAQVSSEIYDVAHGEPLEALALAVALADAEGNAAAGDAARRWLTELRLVKLEIGGSDLLAAGVPAGPEVGRRLRHVLTRKLDGELSGRDAELQAAFGACMSAIPRVDSDAELRFELPGGGRVLFGSRAHGNLSTQTGVGHERGREARDRLCDELGLDWLCASRQVHGTFVQRVRSAAGKGGEAVAIDADGHVTALAGVGAMVLTADCLPVALAGDGVVAMLHAGWRGLAGGVLEEGLSALRELGADDPIEAVIGPGAGVCCYEVGPEVHAAFGQESEDSPYRDGKKIDLRGIAREQLLAAGVARVHDAGACTICDARFFSHRREGARAGRQGGIAWLG